MTLRIGLMVVLRSGWRGFDVDHRSDSIAEVESAVEGLKQGKGRDLKHFMTWREKIWIALTCTLLVLVGGNWYTTILDIQATHANHSNGVGNRHVLVYICQHIDDPGLKPKECSPP